MKIEEYIAKAGRICALPDTCHRIQELIEDDNSTMDDIAEVLSFDPIITGHVLKLANSALYNFSSQVETVSKAVTLLGADAVYNLVLATGTSTALAKLDTSSIDLDRHWRTSINSALIYKRFAKKERIKKADSLFVTGLLHNVGELIVAQVNPTAASKCEELHANQPPHYIQQEVLGFDYATLGAMLFKHWRLPNHMVNLILNQHNIGSSVESQLMFLSTRLGLVSVFPEEFELDQMIPSQLSEQLGYKKADLDGAIDWANIGAFSVFSIVCPQANSVY
ncbi:signal transduction protein [Catenovulum agarivorans DS-2]|uniref:Signal transduction protein n=1 Tax=Catenovulum agarivorans DS-2 TaxID=1328313 RepID=W7QCY7_9ALTE|nr:HDOD domain-containing protein [Catenovulum agarivorans]EWH10754.1 signal transduction protein [Catenovulum agarivorans DS-2]